MTPESNSLSDRYAVPQSHDIVKTSSETETQDYASECWAPRPDSPAPGIDRQSNMPPTTQSAVKSDIGSIIKDLGSNDFRTRETAYASLQDILGGFRDDVVKGRKVKDTTEIGRISAGLFSDDLETSQRIGKSLHECFRTFGGVPLRERLSLQTLQVMTDIDNKPNLEALKSTLDKDAPDWVQKTHKNLDIDLFSRLDTQLQSHRTQTTQDTKAAGDFAQILKDLKNPESLVAEFRTEYALLHAKHCSGGKITNPQNLPDAVNQLTKALKENPQLSNESRFLKIAALIGADANQQFTALLVDDKAKSKLTTLVNTYHQHARVEHDTEIEGEFFDF